MGPRHLFELEKVSYRYKSGVAALCEVDLSVQEGEHVAVLGATRSGKSTLLKILQGSLIPQAGTVRVFGVALRSGREEGRADLRARIGFSGQHPEELLFRPTVLDDLIYGGGVLSVPSAPRVGNVRQICDAFEINELLDRPSAELSSGEKRMVSLAVALIHRPDVLILDEPAMGLSYFLKQRITWLLSKSYLAPRTLLLSTHDFELAEALCERAILLSLDHRKVADGPIQKIFQDTPLLQDAQVIHAHWHYHGWSFHLHRHTHGKEHRHEH